MIQTDAYIETPGGDFEMSFDPKCKGVEFLVTVPADRETACARLRLDEARPLRDWLSARIEEMEG